MRFRKSELRQGVAVLPMAFGGVGFEPAGYLHVVLGRVFVAKVRPDAPEHSSGVSDEILIEDIEALLLGSAALAFVERSSALPHCESHSSPSFSG